MAGGMEMLIKSFGLDPAEIKKNVEGMGQLVIKMAADQQTIMQDTKRILEIVEKENGK